MLPTVFLLAFIFWMSINDERIFFAAVLQSTFFAAMSTILIQVIYSSFDTTWGFVVVLLLASVISHIVKCEIKGQKVRWIK